METNAKSLNERCFYHNGFLEEFQIMGEACELIWQAWNWISSIAFREKVRYEITV